MTEPNWQLISPDRKESKTVGGIDTPYLVFSIDGKQLFGVETKVSADNVESTTLVSVEVATLKKSVLAAVDSDLKPTCNLNPRISFSMADDGKSFLYPVFRTQKDLWLLQGFKQPNWLDRFSRH